MHSVERIQELALEWKSSPSDAVFERLRDNIITYMTTSGMTRLKNLTEDEEQDLFLLLFVDQHNNDRLKPCQLKRSLESYSAATI